MKSHEFGQFLFNSSALEFSQLAELIKAARSSKPTLATKALFLRLVSMSELTESLRQSRYKLPENFSSEDFSDYLRPHESSIQEKYDAAVENLIAARQMERILKLGDGQSIRLAQSLIDSGLMTFTELERILDEFHNLEVPPIETAFADCYGSMRGEIKLDYPLALDAVRSLHGFLSENLKSTLILIPPAAREKISLLGATAKINGTFPVVVGIFAEGSIFHALAERSSHALCENLQADFESVEELLNIHAGEFAVEISSSWEMQEKSEPPRFGKTGGDFIGMKILADVGEFYLYVGSQEIFTV